MNRFKTLSSLQAVCRRSSRTHHQPSLSSIHHQSAVQLSLEIEGSSKLNLGLHPEPLSKIDCLLKLGPVLFDPVRTPRNPIVLCHGLYGFAVRGPSSFPRFQIHYWGKLLEILRSRLGVNVIVGKVPSTGTIEQRAQCLNEMLSKQTVGDVNLLGHSMGGLDARYLITHLKPERFRPVSLTTICTPHRGSPFMDWCRANIGVGSKVPKEVFGERRRTVPFSLKEPLLRPSDEPLSYLPNNLLKLLLLNLVDSPAYSNLSTDFMTQYFNPQTPDDPRVKYWSIASKITGRLSVLHPLWLPSLVLDRLGAQNEGGHDGLVTVESAKWGDFLGIVEDTDHWEIRGRSAFGGLNGTDDVLNQQAKSTWLELNRYLGNWSKTSSEYQEDDQSPIYGLATWIAKRLPLNNNNHSHHAAYRRTIDPAYPIDDLKLEVGQDDFDHSRFDLERFYTAICRHLYEQGL